MRDRRSPCSASPMYAPDCDPSSWDHGYAISKFGVPNKSLVLALTSLSFAVLLRGSRCW